MTRDDATPPALSRAECRAIGTRVLELCPTSARASVYVTSAGGALSTFVRGDMYLASESASVTVDLTVEVDGQVGSAFVNRIDETGLRMLVENAIAAARQQRGPVSPVDPLGPQKYLDPPKLWFQSVLDAVPAEVRAEYCRIAVDRGEAAGLVTAGSVFLQGGSRAIMTTEGLFAYTCQSDGAFRLTARTKDGTGSGAARLGQRDWSRVDVSALVDRAIDMARRSAKPVAVEPGRYTVILEPTAVARLVFGVNLWEPDADGGYTPFSKDPRGTNKIGLRVMDERVWLVTDPSDPELPTATFNQWGNPLDKVTWIERGVLRNLANNREYAKRKNRPPVYPPLAKRLLVEGPTQTLDEMIASTKRGVWVNDMTAGYALNSRTGLVTGTTCNGTFLIENGKITKSLKNFRFTESPIFVLNRLEAAGAPTWASDDMVAPRLKVRDFDFTSLTDAV